MWCPNCGERLAKHGTYCGYCGALILEGGKFTLPGDGEDGASPSSDDKLLRDEGPHAQAGTKAMEASGHAATAGQAATQRHAATAGQAAAAEPGAATPGHAATEPSTAPERVAVSEHPTIPESAEESRESRAHWWAIGILAAFALVIALIIIVPLVQEQVAASRDDHRVTFVMKTPGYNNDATAIPVKVVGTLANGDAYEKLVYLDGGGNGVVLEPGDYTLSFPGGSILANGTVLVAPSEMQLEVNVPTGLSRNEFVQLPTDQAVSYSAVAPLDLSEETLQEVYSLAVEAPGDNGKADTLRENAWQAHETAVEQKAADTAAIEKKAKAPLNASAGDDAQFLGTLHISSPEEAAERIGDESLAWNFYGQTLAVLWLDEPRKVSLEDTSGNNSGGYYDEDGNYVEGDSTVDYEITCLVLNSDVEGLYSYGTADDGTLAALDGSHVLASGKIATVQDWATSQMSPITLASPTFEVV